MDNFLKIQLKKFLSLLPLPEMKIFWVFLPFLAAIFIINTLFLTPFLIFLTGGLVLIIAIIVFFYAASLAKSNQNVGEERTNLKNIIFGLEDSIVVYDENFSILFFNPAAEKLFGLRAESLMGRQISPQDAKDPVLHLLAQVIFPSLSPVMVSRSEPGVYPQKVDLSFADPVFELRMITSPIIEENGKVSGFMKIIRDRTRDVTLLRSKNEFISVASHQLRSPITNIAWALDTLTSDSSLGAEAKDLVLNAREATRELLGIVEDLLMVSKIEEGRFGYNFQSVNVIDFLERVLGIVLPQAQQLGVKVYFEKPTEQIPEVVADTEKITMVMENLFDNAIRYNVKEGEVRVSAKKILDQPFVEVVVQDTGIGISKEDLDKIFSKFFRAENAVKSKTEGSGLGLYIAQNIVRSHGGRIWVESERNRGTTFHFTLATDPRVVPAKELPLEY